MKNPWQEINLETYENHMKSDDVYQLQTLHQITKEQLDCYKPKCVGILGIAGGNGLDQINLHTTQKIYGFDINQDYLDTCQARYSFMGDKLKLFQCDLNDNFLIMPATNLLIANLIIEYLGDQNFVSLVSRNSNHIEIVSCTIQKNEEEGFVSQSNYTSAFDPLLSISHDADEKNLIELFSKENFDCFNTLEYLLPNGKKFIRLDFKRA